MHSGKNFNINSIFSTFEDLIFFHREWASGKLALKPEYGWKLVLCGAKLKSAADIEIPVEDGRLKGKKGRGSQKEQVI